MIWAAELAVLLVISLITSIWTVWTVPFSWWFGIGSLAAISYCALRYRWSLPPAVRAFIGAYAIAGQVVTLLPAFPARSIALYCYAIALLGVLLHFLHRNRPDIAYFLVFIGLSTCPFTELHLKRSLWTIALFSFVLIEDFTARERTGSCFGQHLVQLGAAALFISTVLVGSIFSLYPYGSLVEFGVYLFNFLVFFWLVGRGLDHELRDAVLHFIIGWSMSFSGFGVWAVIDRIMHLGFREGISFRTFVFDRHPNYVTFYITLMTPLMVWKFIQARKLRHRALYGLGTLVSIGYLVMTYSRTSWLTIPLFGVSGVLLFGRGLITRRRLLIAGVTIASALLLLVVFAKEMLPNTFRDRLRSISDLQSDSRLVPWMHSLEIALDYPWLGSGLATKRYLYPVKNAIFAYQAVTRQYLVDAHNTYLELVSSCGFVGLAAFLMFIATILARLLRSRSQQAKVLAVSWLGLLFDFMFHYRLHTIDTSLLIWLLAALSVTVASREPTAGGERNSAARPARALMRDRAVLWAVCLVLGVLSFPEIKQYLFTKGRASLEKGEWGQALTLFEIASRMEPIDAYPYYLLALWRQNRGRLDDAISYFEKSVKLNPWYAFYHDFLGKIFVATERLPEAEEQFAAAVRLEPFNESGESAFILGSVRLRLGKNDPAFDAFMTALGMNPGLAGDPLWQTPETKELLYRVLDEHVIEASNKLSATNHRERDEGVRRLLQMAQAYELLGRPGLADGCLAIVLEHAPQQSEAILQQGELYFKMKLYPQAEYAMLNAAVNDFGYGVYHNMLGRILAAEGKYEESIAEFQWAISTWASISLDNYTAHYYLAQLYEKAANNSEAVKERAKLTYITGHLSEEQRDLQIHAGKINEIKELERVK